MFYRRLTKRKPLQSYLYWGGIAVKEPSSSVLRKPWRNNNIESHPLLQCQHRVRAVTDDAPTEAGLVLRHCWMMWWLTFPYQPEHGLGFVGPLTLWLNCVGDTWPFHCLLLLHRVLDSRELPGTPTMQKLTLRAQCASAPT